MDLYIDIETLPSENMPDIEEVKAKCPGNIKKPESIQKWAEENQMEIHKKQALDSMQGRLLCIGWAFGDDPVQSLIVGMDDVETEWNLLSYFKQELFGLNFSLNDYTWIGHNIKTFDLPWIWRKCLQYRLFDLASYIPRQRYDKRIFDTLEQWAADFKDRVSMGDIAKFLGLESKQDGINGSQIFDLWQAGELQKIRTYCEQDVELVRQIHKIITGQAMIEQQEIKECAF